MATLYILGNGFDLNHGLKTAYGDFRSYLCCKNHNLFEKIEQYGKENFFGSRLTDNWSNIETALYIKDKKLNRAEAQKKLDSIIQSFQVDFGEWIFKIDHSIPLIATRTMKCFTEDDFFINFNYTHTLEKVYNIQRTKIIYIHNQTTGLIDCLNDKYNPVNSIIFGNRKNQVSSCADYKGNYRNRFSKNPKAQIDRYEGQIKNFKEKIDKIVILGHSMDFSNGDGEYFKKLAAIFPNIPWIISYHTPKDKTQVKKSIKKLKKVSSQLKTNIIYF